MVPCETLVCLGWVGLVGVVPSLRAVDRNLESCNIADTEADHVDLVGRRHEGSGRAGAIATCANK